MIVFVFLAMSQWAVGYIMRTSQQTRSITALQIRSLQTDEKSKNRFVVVDVRSKEETDVSVIPGSLTKSEFEKTASQHHGKTVIVYCTTGVRSNDYAGTLNQKGWRAWNYKGSILDWCKNEFPLMTQDGKPTKRVHTYSRWYPAPGEYVAVY